MFGKKISGKTFGYKPIYADTSQKDVPLRERMKFTSFSSQEGRNTKKKTIISVLFLLLVVGIIIYYGISFVSMEDLKIKDNDFEKITP